MDDRIPVVFTGATAAEDALLTDQGFEAAAHGTGCACCGGRSGAARALTSLFQAMAKGERPPFRRVVVRASPAGEAAVRTALSADRLVAARFRAAE